jgi:hypothetical protein
MAHLCCAPQGNNRDEAREFDSPQGVADMCKSRKSSAQLLKKLSKAVQCRHLMPFSRILEVSSYVPFASVTPKTTMANHLKAAFFLGNYKIRQNLLNKANPAF